MKRSRILPWPPVILAMISLPQRTAQVITPMSDKTMIKIILVIMRRALLGFFLSFLVFLSFFFLEEATNSPLSPSKSKACTGLRKSSIGSILSRFMSS